MGIKKRPAPTAADIEAFGDAADQPLPSARAAAAPTARRKAFDATPTSGEWPEGVARTMLIRWPTPELASQLVDVTALLKAAGDLDGRSQHATALRAMERGLQAIESELRS